jgi:hypothetical protein
MLSSGCSLIATSAAPHRATPGGPPTGCDSIVFPIGDFVVAPVSAVSGGLLFVGQSVEGSVTPQKVAVPVLLVGLGITALASGIVGLSRIGRCSDQLPRAKADAPSAPTQPIDPTDDSRPSWGE